MKATKVGVIMGGVSSERQVSLMTGKEMMANLDDKYEAVPIELNSTEELIDKVKGIDIALLALHGKYGEDGTVQGTLETLGIPYTGSGVLSSSLCMDKELTKKIIRFEGLATPDWMLIASLDELDTAEAGRRLGYPVVVKPNTGGSSIGVQIADGPDRLRQAVADTLAWDREVLLEQLIAGDKITCAVLNGTLLPTVSIKAKAHFFDYSSKYCDGGAEEEVIELPEPCGTAVREAALRIYQAMKCSVYARIDMMLADGIPYVLEVNTLPGLTKNSLLPKSAKAAGLSYSRLLDEIITHSLRARKTEEAGLPGR
ncbi:D-alanine--D-alanine ligase [Paenibacillus dendritiformis]|uniref:D-alanine--D-alanine ligase n=1 Tax=Paenibacillus dendritiformis TaxID=130049 RepID=UPI000DA7CCFF|nr:D-alanine--D-alanine ligase [Paenibacillus dendritiformis]PZM65053.1 D-alanine--D-alanine ligase [Paenibacillus dendritiformis]